MTLIGTDCIEDAGNDNIFGESRKIMSEVALCVILKLFVSFSVFVNLKIQIFQLARFPKNTLTFETWHEFRHHAYWIQMRFLKKRLH